MNNIEKLLEDKYPDSEISHIQRAAFEEGWNTGLNPETHHKMRDMDISCYNSIQDHSDFHTIK